MGNHWVDQGDCFSQGEGGGGEKKNINIPDFSPLDFAFSPRRWWAIYRVAGGVSSFPPVFSFLGVEGWALRRGGRKGGLPTAYAYFNWNSRTPTSTCRRDDPARGYCFKRICKSWESRGRGTWSAVISIRRREWISLMPPRSKGKTCAECAAS